MFIHLSPSPTPLLVFLSLSHSLSLSLPLSLSTCTFLPLLLFYLTLPLLPPLPPSSPQGGTSKDLREVRQFHFTAWPDFGVPDFPTSMLSMIRCVRAHHNHLPQETGPMIVHCSAGVGRTGTFIVIDSMLPEERAVLGITDTLV